MLGTNQSGIRAHLQQEKGSAAHSRRTKGLAGVAVVAYLLATGRWGSHIGYAPLYLTDLLLAVTLYGTLLKMLVARERILASPRLFHWAFSLLVLFFFWAFIRFVFSPALTLVAIRDAAPYLYCIVAALGTYSYTRSSEGHRQRTVQIIKWALLFHLIWVTVVVAAPFLRGHIPNIPFAGIKPFTLRGDYDSAIVGVTACFFLRRLLSGEGDRKDVLMVVWCVLTVAWVGTRAGLIASFVAIMLTLGLLFGRHLTGPQKRAKRMLVVLAPILILGLVFFVPQTPAGAKLLSGFGITSFGVEGGKGEGTYRARLNAWPAVVSYSAEDPVRLLAGVGFGPSFLAESGADALLTGLSSDEDRGTRSPHNYLLGTLARLGLVGSLMFVLIMCGLAAIAVRRRRELAADELGWLAVVSVCALFTASMFGVVLEAPFGAIPFFWFAGILCGVEARARRLDATSVVHQTG